MIGATVGVPSVSGGSQVADIQLLAPRSGIGFTKTATPILYYFVAKRVTYRMSFTITAASDPAPLVAVALAKPEEPGFYGVRLADLGVKLSLGQVYTWSISAAIDPARPGTMQPIDTAKLARDLAIVAAPPASGSPLYYALPAPRSHWYDLLADAVDARGSDGHLAFETMLEEIGLTRLADFDRVWGFRH
jgi:hypothetical protein